MAAERPSPNDMHLAAEWLDAYEGEDDAEACQRVRAWLIQQAEATELRQACRDAGVSVAEARRAIRLNHKES